jgi:hypothetical protein
VRGDALFMRAFGMRFLTTHTSNLFPRLKVGALPTGKIQITTSDAHTRQHRFMDND